MRNLEVSIFFWDVLCHLSFSVGCEVVPLCDSTKSVTTTCASPSFFTHLPTVLRICSNRRSSASRWASVRIGARGSWERDSRITSLSRYSDLAKSFSLNNVDRLMLWEAMSARFRASFETEFLLNYLRMILTRNIGSRVLKSTFHHGNIVQIWINKKQKLKLLLIINKK